ncbi:unnamed protein product [Meganyctiphanes norvegica]|uniref:Uncharacterized protein n=1 Tax=Meganyctiphanes norvegica TaxID=48144 RepID=A0AAV2PQH5_MEGNR
MKILLILTLIAVLTVDCRDFQDQPGNSDEATGQDQRGEERTAYGAEAAYGYNYYSTELQDVKEQKSIELQRYFRILLLTIMQTRYRDLLKPPRERLEICKNSFQYQSLCLWNKLENKIKNSTTLYSFKSNVKYKLIEENKPKITQPLT